jgi:hypothetical protein
MLAFMLDPQYRGLGLVINYVGKKQALKIEGEYDKQVLFLLLVCAYMVLNLNDACERAPNSFTSQNSQTTNLYDCKDMDEDMPLKNHQHILRSRRSLMMNVRTLGHGGEPKRGISPMSGLLFVKSWELCDSRLKEKKFSAL